MSQLSRADQVAGEALSALRPADGPARFFLLHLLGGSVAGGGGAGCLHHLRGVSAVEPDALKGIASRHQEQAPLQDKQPASHAAFRLISIIHHPTGLLPVTTEPDSKIPAIGIDLNVPAFVWSGKDVAADNSNGCARDHIMGVMFSRLHATVSDKGGGGVCRDAILPTVTLAHKLGGTEGNRGVRRRKGLTSAIGAFFVDGVLETVGDPECQSG